MIVSATWNVDGYMQVNRSVFPLHFLHIKIRVAGRMLPRFLTLLVGPMLCIKLLMPR